MLKLTRKTQQGIVVYPKDDKQNALVIRVVDIVPNSVSLGFEGDGLCATDDDIQEFVNNINVLVKDDRTGFLDMEDERDRMSR